MFFSRSVETAEACSFEQQLAGEIAAIHRARQALEVEPTAGGTDSTPDTEGPQREPEPTGEQGQRAIQGAHAARLLGLALSGGGIRSATFNLGVLQGLARLRLLHRIDYLSTVSGGGYIGGWLSAWVHRRERYGLERAGVLGVEEALATQDAPGLTEPPEVSWLRTFSNYLTPRLGVFSTDTLTGAATYLRNLLLNQTMLTAVGLLVLLIPWVLVGLTQSWDYDHVLVGFTQSWDYNNLSLGLALLLLLLGAWWAGFETLRAGESGEIDPHRDSDIAPAPDRRSWCRFGDSRAEPPHPLHAQKRAAGERSARRRYWLILGCFVVAALLGGPPLILLPSGPWPWVLGLGYGLGAAAGWYGAVARKRPNPAQAKPAPTAAGRGGPLRARLTLLWAHLAPLLWALAAGVLFSALLMLAGVIADSTPESRVSPLVAVTFGPLAFLLALSLGITFHIGLSGRSLRETAREIWSRQGAHLLRVSAGWLVCVGLSLFGPLAIILTEGWIAAMGGVVWILTTVAGVIAGAGPATGGRGSNRMAEILARVAPYVFILGLLITLSYGLYSLMWMTRGGHCPPHEVVCQTRTETLKQPIYRLDRDLRNKEAEAMVFSARTEVDCLPGYVAHSGPLAASLWPELLAWMLGVLGLAVLLGRRVDINVFGFHMFYRNRIERCYLGASTPERSPHPLTGLDPNDAPPLGDLTRGGDPHLAQRPLPIFNAAMNITSARNLAWQERKAASFTFTPLFCGYGFREPDGQWHSAYQPTGDYLKEDGGWISLGLPVTTSGAAVSPNAGYHTSAATAFLLTLFNLRLGWWMQNPRDGAVWQRAGPKWALAPLLKELAGLTSDRSKYVYLSDGGHFENLGIYELVRRRCRYIIACDAGCDPGYGFEDLGNAVRKCKVDFGIDIDISPHAVKPYADSPHSTFHCAVGKIHYERLPGEKAEPGYLLYLKASLTGDEPSDVVQYRAQNPRFPHQSTADQWFSESQFESYRALGCHILEQVLAQATPTPQQDHREANFEEFFSELAQRWYPPSRQVQANFSKHGKAIESIFERLRRDERLRFLDSQIYPEWWRLQGADSRSAATAVPPAPSVWPEKPEEVRSGFYLCNSLIQLMENVYLDLGLEDDFGHPDNRGWMNLFRHWSWSGMFRVTWAISASVYGARFQSFCRRRLDLPLGEVACGSAIAADGDLEGSSLNVVERQHIRQLLGVRPGHQEIRQLWLQVKDPFAGEKGVIFEFPFAFALIEPHADASRLSYYRVQDHLRSMGLGRQGLALLHAEGIAEELAEWSADKTDEISTRIPEANLPALQSLWSSVTGSPGGGRSADTRWVV